MRKLLKGQCVAPRVIITDKLKSYNAARREIMPRVEHHSHKGLNNRAENSHLAVRQRERGMGSGRQGQYQRFMSIHCPIAKTTTAEYRIPNTEYRKLQNAAMIA